jgi:hypothetical protein
MSAPIIRSAIKAIMRRNVKCTFSSDAVGTHASSLSTLSLPSYYNLDNKLGSGLNEDALHGSAFAPAFDVHRCDVSECINTKSLLADILASISGNGALFTTDCIQILSSATLKEGEEIASTESVSLLEVAASKIEELSIWLISTLKRRKKMMNKHKLRKRRKKLRLKSKK